MVLDQPLETIDLKIESLSLDNDFFSLPFASRRKVASTWSDTTQFLSYISAGLMVSRAAAPASTMCEAS
jgi:hypothetical protein